MFWKSLRKIDQILRISVFGALFLGWVGFSTVALAQKRISADERPGWIDKAPPGYFIGVSHRFTEESDARADALKDAKRQIIESLGVVIESEFIDQLVEATGDIESSNAFAQSRVKVVAKNIIAVKPEMVYVEQWKEREGLRGKIIFQAYVAVPFSEREHRQFISELVEETCNLGEDQFDATWQRALQGKIFLAAEQFKVAAEDMQAVLDLTGISPSDLARLKKLQDRLQVRADELIKGIRLEGSGDDQKAKLGSGLAQPLRLNVFSQAGGQRIPLPGLLVDFGLVAGEATLTPQAYTNAAGEAACDIKEINSGANLEIEARVNFPEDYNIGQNSYTFHLFSENRVVLHVVETSMDKPVKQSYLANQLGQRLTQAGFSVLEERKLTRLSSQELETIELKNLTDLLSKSRPDLIILGTLTTGEINQARENIYFARARGALRVFNLKRQELVSSLVQDEKEAGNTPENAARKVLTKVADTLIEQLIQDLGLTP